MSSAAMRQLRAAPHSRPPPLGRTASPRWHRFSPSWLLYYPKSARPSAAAVCPATTQPHIQREFIGCMHQNPDQGKQRGHSPFCRRQGSSGGVQRSLADLADDLAGDRRPPQQARPGQRVCNPDPQRRACFATPTPILSPPSPPSSVFLMLHGGCLGAAWMLHGCCIGAALVLH